MACDILIAGGTAGGVAAALAAASLGANVCLLEETQWLGGQLTTQGVCTPDEQQHIETFGGTSTYMAFRNAVRAHYLSQYTLSEAGRSAERFSFNPGLCWVSRISFEPAVGATLLREMTLPFETAGNLEILFGAKVKQIKCDSSGPQGEIRIASVQITLSDGSVRVIEPRFLLDATDTGELLPLCGEEGTDWFVGAEAQSETGEPDAPPEARRHWVQPFTFPFPIDWSPETTSDNIIEPPTDYEALKTAQRYHVKHGAITGLFAGGMPWWRYRRVLARDNFNDPRIPADLAMINTAGNDYYGGNIIGTKDAGTELISVEEAAEQLARARRASLGYLYWLQTECLREADDLAAAPGGGADITTAGGKGYPEFRLRRDLFPTDDGCSIMPYIRESRRIKALGTVREQEIVVRDFSGKTWRGEQARAAYRPDSVGIGHYALDIHPNGHGEPNHYVATRAFQIPLSALLPKRIVNLLPACKNLGLTHLTNGAFRLHPIEWNIGESVGSLAAWCLAEGVSPTAVLYQPALLEQFQETLVSRGVALHWFIDVPVADPTFAAVQWLAARSAAAGALPGSPTNLLFRPDEPISFTTWQFWQRACNGGAAEEQLTPGTTRREAAISLYKRKRPERR